MKEATIYELCKALFSILCRHPELKNKKVSIHTECGYSGASFPKPIRVYTHENLDDVSILTDDDNGVEERTEFTVYS